MSGFILRESRQSREGLHFGSLHGERNGPIWQAILLFPSRGKQRSLNVSSLDRLLSSIDSGLTM